MSHSKGNTFIAIIAICSIVFFTLTTSVTEVAEAFYAVRMNIQTDISHDNFLYLVDAGNSIGEMDLPHDVAVSNSGHIIVAEINKQRLQVFKSHSDIP